MGVEKIKNKTYNNIMGIDTLYNIKSFRCMEGGEVVLATSGDGDGAFLDPDILGPHIEHGDELPFSDESLALLKQRIVDRRARNGNGNGKH